MARPRLGLGEWGKIGYSWKGDRVRAYTNYRSDDGTISKVERWGADEDEAKQTLVKHLKSLSGKNAVLTTQSTFRMVADEWMKDIENDVQYTTRRRYEACLRNQLIPLIGNLTLTECKKPSRLQKAIDQIVKDHSPSTAQLSRSIMHGVFRYAILADLMDSDPAALLKNIKGRRERIQRLDADELREFFAAVDADRYMQHSYIPDLLRLIFGTGVRIGEALAIEWQHVNLGTTKKKVSHPEFGDRVLPPGGVWINGNIVHGPGSKPIRHDGKTDSSEGVLILSPFLVTLLQYRLPEDAHPTDPVFPGTRYHYQPPQLAIRSIKNLCRRIGYEEVTSKWGRKTVASWLSEEGYGTQVRNQLRHSNTKTAERHYIARMPSVEASEAIERLFTPKPAE